MEDTAEMLRLEGVSKSFPGVKALTGIDLSIRKGEVHALLGENGAGKSTLMKILGGIHQADEGRIFIEGSEHRFAGYNDAIAAGIGIIFQEFSLVPYLNAVENIFLGRYLKNRFGLMDKAAMKRSARELFDELGVQIDLDAPICRLSVAQQQFVEIGKALSLKARLLVLDEPTATLTPNEAGHLFRIMRELRAKGVAMIFISHHLDEIFEVCDRISVLRDGANAGHAEVGETNVDALVEMMVGRRIEHSFPPKPQPAPRGRKVLEVPHIQLAKGGPVNAFELHEGEILGFAGLVGSGRTELALGMMGADRVHRKTVLRNGKPVRLDDPTQALENGIGLLPESRKVEGLITDFTIRFNISLNNLGRHRSAGLVSRASEERSAAELSRRVGVKAPGIETRVATLSGGNQQKVVIARWLGHECEVLIFDEPTRGIDVGAKAEIYGLMREFTRQGKSIVMISSELPEIVGMCDRVAVFSGGSIVATLEGDSINSGDIMRHATKGGLQ
ncbi:MULTISPECIES: sugar ABC transporter ATP-binding protein [unclassified Variovorax]|jgi:ribose transport system ATP-binding protein|uniref:sugar ABC transporter ATP-binding protein n=1 Tax=unclassified Variovorax TaxID=663243 RepID=UPI000F7FA5D8|nr:MULTISPECIES: sugar ABC transporter ATP-binding protein [unclassified Variovorax]RSZ42434.1 sugar ABC transporter ATP-binding protein [Variovorax sp. 553]RSZ43408.1 sugar ABC transporter ATP-binding protein [Variovorax sp. 679]